MSRTITNLAGLPLPMYTALKANTYTGGGGHISITRLISPPRITALRKTHEDQIIEDAASRIWSLLGSSVHRMLELSADETTIVERNLRMETDGWVLTGQPDLYVPGRKAIYDYKVTSVWSVLHTDKPEWEAQINMQAMLHRHKGDEVDEGYIVAVLRDWQVRRSKFEKDYPAVAVQKIAIPLWDQKECIKYASYRIAMHKAAQEEYELNNNVSKLPLCTPEERWFRGGSFACIRKKSDGQLNKKADRKFDTRQQAEQWMSTAPIPKGTSWAPIQERPGENIRCNDYCDVAPFCDFAKKLVQDDRELFDAQHADAAD